MSKMSFRRTKKTTVGKLMTGVLLGGAVGAVVSWLSSPARASEPWRRLRGDVMDARERAKTADGNLESQARELVQDIGENPAMGRPRTTGVEG